MAKLSPKKKPAAKKTATPKCFQSKRAQMFLKETSKKTSKRGDLVDFADLDYKVVLGTFEGFAGMIVPEEEVATYEFGGMKIADDKNEEEQMKQRDEEVVILRLLKNKRGNKPRESWPITFKKSEVEELGLNDMFQYVGNEDDEVEDEGLVEAEKKPWTCARCNHENTHDASCLERPVVRQGDARAWARGGLGASGVWIRYVRIIGSSVWFSVAF